MIERLVVWGGCEGGEESHRWIQRAFYENALKLGIESYWVPNEFSANRELKIGSTVISADIYGSNLRHHQGVDYVLHNFSQEHPVLQEAPPESVLRLRVWTNDAFGEEWADFRRYDRSGRILFQPWGTNMLKEEFLGPVHNPDSEDVVFIGAIWSDVRDGVELGNVAAIDELRSEVERRGLRFVHHTQIVEQEAIRITREARFAPVIVGNWQCEHGYLPCRAFKHASWGVPVFTNSSPVSAWCGDAEECTIEELFDVALELDQEQSQQWVEADQQAAANYTYKESLETIDRALQEGK